MSLYYALMQSAVLNRVLHGDAHTIKRLLVKLMCCRHL